MHQIYSMCIKDGNDCYCYENCASTLRRRLGFCTSDELKKIVDYMCLLRPHFFTYIRFKRISSRPVHLILKTLESFNELEIDRVLWLIDTFYSTRNNMELWKLGSMTPPPPSLKVLRYTSGTRQTGFL